MPHIYPLLLWSSAVGALELGAWSLPDLVPARIDRQLRWAWATDWTLVAAGWWLAGFSLPAAIGLSLAGLTLLGAIAFVPIFGGLPILSRRVAHLAALGLAAGGLAIIALTLFIVGTPVGV